MLATWLGASSTRTVVLITEPDVANLCESGFIRGSSWVGISSLTWREIGVRGASKVRGAVPSISTFAVSLAGPNTTRGA